MREREGGSWGRGRLTGLIDGEALRELLNNLRLATGLPMEIRDDHGFPLVSADALPAFCTLVRERPRGMSLCCKKAVAHCPTTVGKTAQFATYDGVHHLISPILAEGEFTGALLVGPFLLSALSERAVPLRAHFLSLPEDQLLQAASDIPTVGAEQVEASRRLMAAFSTTLSQQATLASRNEAARLEQRRSLEEIATLRHVMQVINSGLDLGRTLNLIAQFALEMTKSDAALIRLLEADDLVVRGEAGLRTVRSKHSRIKLGEYVAGRVAAEGKAITLIDIQQCGLAQPSRFVSRNRFHGYLCIPIQARGKVLGVLSTFKRKRYRYSDDEVKRLSSLANEAAVAVENALLYEERVRAENRASLLAEAGKLFASSLDVEEILQVVAEKVGKSLDVLCGIYLLEADGETLTLKGVHHPNQAKVDLVLKMIEASPVRVGRGLAGRAIMASRTIVVDGQGPDAFPGCDRPYFRAMNPTSAISVPLRAKDRILGAMIVSITDSDRRFDAGDIGLVEQLAERTATSIENAQLYHRARTEQMKLEAVISGMADGVVIVDKDGKMVTANRAAQEIFGKPTEARMRDTGSSPLREPSTIDCPSCPIDVLPLNKVLTNGGGVVIEEITLRRDDGDSRTCQVSAAPVLDAAGAITGAVAVLRDVTAIREVERMKDEFISVVSHELRAPLTAISGYTQMLARQLSKRPSLEVELGELDLVNAHAQRLTTLVQEILDIPRLESGRLRLNKHSVSLQALTKAFVDRLRLPSDAHTVKVRVPKDLPPVYADPRRVEQILWNLINNAVKYSPNGGQVLVSVKPHGQEAIVSVRDWGIGIERKELHKLFERFYRVDNKENREFEGIGLGLHIARMLVESHDGSIWATSRKGHGSAFSFSLPFVGGKSD